MLTELLTISVLLNIILFTAMFSSSSKNRPFFIKAFSLNFIFGVLLITYMMKTGVFVTQ